MKCRRVKREDGINNIVWFGSYGLTQDGKAKFFNEDNIHDNYGEFQVEVADGLTQRLSVLEGELWYDVEIGLPLLNKNTSKLAIDAVISSTILEHPEVLSIDSFESEVVDHKYSAKIEINSIYGQVILSI